MSRNVYIPPQPVLDKLLPVGIADQVHARVLMLDCAAEHWVFFLSWPTKGVKWNLPVCLIITCHYVYIN